MSLYRMTHPDKEAEDGICERLVEANNVNVARNHVARQIIQGEIAKNSDIFRLAKAGVEVEVARETPAAAGAPSGEDDGGDAGSGGAAGDGPKVEGDGKSGEAREPNEPPAEEPTKPKK